MIKRLAAVSAIAATGFFALAGPAAAQTSEPAASTTTTTTTTVDECDLLGLIAHLNLVLKVL